MARTDETRVSNVIATTLTSGQIEAFIDDASVWVTEELVTNIAPTVLSADRLELIERYLACAFIRLRDLGLKSTKLDDVSEQYQVNSEVTDYLLRAAGFDPTGTVKKHFMPVGERQPALFRVGKGYRNESPR